MEESKELVQTQAKVVVAPNAFEARLRQEFSEKIDIDQLNHAI
jgi:hypothetical protein